ncbi:MAG: hypothetical protein SFW36_03575 [Leptolyngbyaceae cyanobacterium bins.59]|nr:hypothetical protein [Leptolyngbyaceae cyanobacterium bins.59]
MPSHKLNHKPPSKPSARPAPVPPDAASHEFTNRPSVPLYVYKELAAELQAAKVMLDSLHTKNQHLTRQNQQLRQEMERVVEAVVQMQQVVDGDEHNSSSVLEPSPTPKREKPVEAAKKAPVRSAPRPVASKPDKLESPLLSGDLVTEQEGSRPSFEQKPERVDLGGLWLAVVILMIVLSAFGAGFVIVRPFLQSR